MAWVNNNNNGANVLQLTRCFNSLITEDKLNQKIRSTEDLSVLCSLLEVKLYLINDSKHSPVIYNIDFILSKLNITDVDVLSHILKVALMVQPDVGEYLKLFQFIKENISAEPLQYLKFLKILLDLCKCKKEEDAFIQYVDDNAFDLVISNLIDIDTKPLINYLNVNILPYYLNINCDSSKNLFVQILKHTLEKKSLDIFCANPQIFIENNDSLLKDDCFWYLLQTGLNNNSSTIQKQALFILKKAIKSCQRLKCFNTTLGVVSWNADSKTQTFSAWQNLFILYEVSREKQLHLIEPIYQLIPTITILHPSWLSSVFRIFLLHPQQAVCSYILIDLLKSNWYYDDAAFKDVVKCLIYVLNKTEFALNESVWMHLYKFARNLSDEQFIHLLQETVNISWIPPVCYRLYRTIFNSKTDVFIPISVASQIITNLRKLPHKFIRDECLRLTIEYVHKPHFERANFRESLELNNIFFKDNFELWKLDNFEKFIPDIRATIKSWIGCKDGVDLKEVEALLKIIQTLNDADVESLLYKLFTNKELSNAILDRMCVLFYQDVNILSYFNTRLISMQKCDDSYLRRIVPILTIHQSDEILETCSRILLTNESNDVQVEISFAIVNHLSEVINSNLLQEILIKWETKFLENKNRNAHTCLSFMQLYSKKRIVLDQRRTIQIFEHILETQEFVIVPEIFAQLKFLINSCADVEILFPFIDLCAQKLFELKGSTFFKAAVENFINSILLNNVILLGNDEIVFAKCRDLLRLLYKWVNTVEVVGCSLSENLCKLSELNSNAFKFIPIALKLLLFGDILKKDQRAEYNVCQMISRTNSEKSSKNPNLRKIAIRGEIIKYLQNILNSERDVKKREQKADAIWALLLKKYLRYVNKRCFSDSQVHLIKLRILQALLLIHDKMGHKEGLIDHLLNSLCTESHQLSNKFIVIWLLIRLLHIKDNCLDLISAKIQSTNKMHSSTISAFIPVLYHVALLKNDDAFSVKVFKQLLPWTMGAHFHLRLYAQVGIKKIYDRMNNKKICDQFKEVVEGVVEVLDKTDRDIEIFDKYIFDVFNPMADFNLETIYYTIPHITNVTNDEYENISNILNFSIDTSLNLDDLRTVQLKNKKQTNQNISTSVIQKKIIPQDSVHRKIGELIVVASLVDKIPNLGGISRTSEVFGVKELVINSLSTIKNPEFQSLSMSSENWINITEVKVDDLQLFLLAMKEKGFLVVGAEQTSESVKLNNFNFPCKCLLLLGNEKEGIPPNLLSLIDICVEIPQLGVVRSLNVHVAAATFIWEYTKAHML
ncbi:hypothetical protein FQR65_LT06109 [Abscondita terminalis]|nr:hypothetical protein FQR65_LT06109 [Abscondita terminalis]